MDSDASNADPANRQDPGFRFSLGTVFLAMTCAAIYLGAYRLIGPGIGGYFVAVNLVYFVLLFWLSLVRQVKLTAVTMLLWILAWIVAVMFPTMMMPA